MPKFLVTSGSYFEPYTYDQLSKPVVQAVEAHSAAQDAYDQLSMETSSLGRYISDNPGDANAKLMYDSYLEKLNSLQSNLWNNGYNAATRRDLASARAGYAGDITRLQAAIKARQERSKEYWDARHKNPDLVTGADPGLGGLDAYLSDDNYGRNYFSYSGDKFMEEVGVDAKASASEMLRDPKVVKDPNLVGYLTRISQDGFTNAEVDAASFAVKAAMSGDPTLLNSLDPASAILANILTSHLESTGAAGKIDSSEMARLLDYGKAGLRQAVGKRKDDVVADKVWAFNKELEMAQKKADIEVDTHRRKHDIDNPQPAEDGNSRGYEQNAAYQRLLSKTAQKTSDEMHDSFHKNYKNDDGSDKEVPIKLPNNGLIIAKNATEATDAIYNNEARKRILDEMGLDVALKGYNLFRTNSGRQYSSDGHFRTGDLSRKEEKELGLNPGDVAVQEYVNGKWVLNPGYTQAFNRGRKAYEAYVDYTKKLNPDLKISDYTLLPDQVEKIRKAHPGMENVPFEDLETAILREEVDQLSVAPQLVGTGQEYDDARQRYARLIDDFYAGLSGAEGLGASSVGAFHKVGKGGYDYSEKGETNKASVFSLTSDGHIDPNCISSIYMLPQDINGNDTKLRIRVLDKNGNGTDWVVSAKMFGPTISAAVNDPTFVSAMQYVSMPMSNSTDIFSSSDSDSAAWAVGALNVLGNRYPILDENYPTAKDILRSDMLYNNYISAVNSYVQDYLSAYLDRTTLGVRQHPGYTSAKATSNLPQ